MLSLSRRQFLQGSLALAGLSLMSGCAIAFGPSTQRGELYRVGCLQSSAPPSAGGDPGLEAFRQGLREHGYIEGQ